MRSDEVANVYALLEVENALNLMRSASLSDFSLPEPSYLPTHPQGNQTPIERMEQLRQEVSNAIILFKADQNSVFNEVVGAVLLGGSADNLNASLRGATTTTSKAFVLHFPAGKGRTYLTRSIDAFLQPRSMKVIAVASFSLAAALIDGGRTTLSNFKLPIYCDLGSTRNISVPSQLVRQLREANLILWDEAVISHKCCEEALHWILPDMKKNSLRFRGKAILFIGCFRQILPVTKCGSRYGILQACIKASELFAQFRILRFFENMLLEKLLCGPRADPSTWRTLISLCS